MEIRKRNAALDGLRAWAIMLIIASHCGVLAQGGVGNAIFFVISGFFASMPFCTDNPEKSILSLKGIAGYYMGKILRIIPLFLCVICAAHFLMGFWDRSVFVKNMLFIQSDGHLWFLQQEMFIYLLMPVIMLIMFLCKKIIRCRHNDIVCAGILLILAAVTYKYFTIEVFYLVGNSGHQPIRFSQFFIGMAAGYLYREYLICGKEWGNRTWVRCVCNIYNIAFFAFCLLTSRSILKLWKPELSEFLIGWRMPNLCSGLAAVSILCFVVADKGLVTRIVGNRIMAYLGRISFSLYLTHYFIVVKYGMNNGEISTLLLAFTLSTGVTLLAYYLVEKPFTILASAKRFGAVVDYYKNIFK